MLYFAAIAGLAPPKKVKFEITPAKIGEYRKHPVRDTFLLNVIEKSPNFVHFSDNPNIIEAIIEHDLIDKIEYPDYTTYFVFEYFFLEGVSCNIKAISLNKQREVLGVIQLACFEEYPDGKLVETAYINNDIAHHTRTIHGLKEYVDSLDKFIMRIDKTITTYKLNNYRNIETLDSVVEHHEYFK